ncbi:hypothetical protein VTK73DRAFT_819 [Phialemonium thermophilum]|uniref:Uncharacterized protein n=1 Tax=Phialemonium thermophilum TaxID=223376 RepID=A0ABR3VUA0_9PEZI
MFSEEVVRLRAEYQRKRQASNLFPPAGRPVLDSDILPGTPPSVRYWYGTDDTKPPEGYVRLFDLPGTLSGDILHLERGLPPAAQGYCEIEGDLIRPLDRCPDLPRPAEDDVEDVRDLVARRLPLVEVDPSRHFVKKGKYRSEVENLLACQGGSCPGEMLSEHLVRLLGRSADGMLVFEKLARPWPILARTSALAVYKT